MKAAIQTGKVWRILRQIVIAIAVLLTLAAVLITEENWRGKRAWENYKRAAEARGEHFDWTAFDAPNVPDDQNFFKAPVFSGLMTTERDERTQNYWSEQTTNWPIRLHMSVYRSDHNYPNGANGNWRLGRLTDLRAWQEYYRSSQEFPVASQPQTPAADVLLALSKYDAAIEELREASRRPFSRLEHNNLQGDPQGYAWRYLLLQGFKNCAQVLQLRASAELADRQDGKALDDVMLLLRLDEVLKQEPLIVTHLLSLSVSSLALQATYEGLAQDSWNDAQLSELERTLATKDYLAHYQGALKGEKVFDIQACESRRITRETKMVEFDGTSNRVRTIRFRFTPSGYFYQSELACAQLYDEFVLPLVDVTNRQISPSAMLRSEKGVREWAQGSRLFRTEPRMMFPALSRAAMRSAAVQNQVDLARVACALNRYKLVHGSYPDSLGNLEPQFIQKLPHDIINGEPLHYRNLGNGKYLLYSVGWNEKDDGGVVAKAEADSHASDLKQGDWVWKY
jgi:hypothetical protein